MSSLLLETDWMGSIKRYGKSWHNQDELLDVINKETAKKAFPKLIAVENPILPVEGGEVKLEGFKILLADLRSRLDEEKVKAFCPGGLLPLHVPKDRYAPLENERFFEVIERAISGIGECEITSIMTLDNNKVFVVSVDQGDLSEFSIGPDKWLSRWTFVTSHDGRYAIEAMTTNTRVVCNNTLQLALKEARNKLKLKHTEGGIAELDGMADAIKEGLEQRKAMKETLSSWRKEKMSMAQAMALYLCYYGGGEIAENGEFKPGKEDLSTQQINSTREAAILFARGRGNTGSTLYDAFNGFTDYYTEGEGTGKKSTLAERHGKSEFGKAAEHKTEFYNRVSAIVEAGKLGEAIAYGERAERVTLATNTAASVN